MRCPQCNSKAYCHDSRAPITVNHMVRRYRCSNKDCLTKFKTIEEIFDERFALTRMPQGEKERQAIHKVIKMLEDSIK